MKDRDLIVALDLGTSKIHALVAAVDGDGQLEVLGDVEQPAQGMKKGMVVNMEKTAQAIESVIHELESQEQCEVGEVTVGIAGSHIRSMNSNGLVLVEDGEVSQQDMDNVIKAARAVNLPKEQQILHAMPQEYKVGNQDEVSNPLGMSTLRLEVNVHLVTAAVTAMQNLVKCVSQVGLEVEELVLEPLASAEAVLNEDEKELGVCLVDIGAGTTDLALFVGGVVRYTTVIPIGGDHVTNDIAVGFGTPKEDAEHSKCHYGIAFSELMDKSQQIILQGTGEHTDIALEQSTLMNVIESRYREIFQLVAKKLVASGLEELIPSGVVLTGGGSCMKGAKELAASMWGVPVRIGAPQGLADKDPHDLPRYATGMGLLYFALHSRQKNEHKRNEEKGLAGLLAKIKQWFGGG